MPSPKEIEIKLEFPSRKTALLRDMALLRRTDGLVRREKLTSVYFDTPGLELRKKGLTLRVRHNGSRAVQTIKAEGNSLFERGEWETEIDGDFPDLMAARSTPLEKLMSKKLRKRLRPVFETRVQRTTYPLKTKSYDIALTLDRGEIDTGRNTTPIHEAELELQRGDSEALFKVARTFSRQVSAELAVKSKSQRGYELLSGDDSAVSKADAVQLAADMPASAAFQLIASGCLKQVIANKTAILAEDAEGIHQMRIGLRRMRAAISLFSGILPDVEAGEIKTELKWLTAELAPAREFDVFLTRVVGPLKRNHTLLAGMQGLSHDLAKQREAAVERALAAVNSGRFRELVLNVASWLEAGDWRKPRAMSLRVRSNEPIETVAIEQLARRQKKLLKRGRLLRKLSPPKRHKLRIQAKKLRYASEFFETVFVGKKAAKRRKAFLSALKGMQDCLGDMNDISVHESLSTAIVENAAARGNNEPRRAFAAGLLAGSEQARLQSTIAAAERSYAAFSK